jgi:hypothetical protein
VDQSALLVPNQFCTFTLEAVYLFPNRALFFQIFKGLVDGYSRFRSLSFCIQRIEPFLDCRLLVRHTYHRVSSHSSLPSFFQFFSVDFCKLPARQVCGSACRSRYRVHRLEKLLAYRARLPDLRVRGPQRAARRSVPPWQLTDSAVCAFPDHLLYAAPACSLTSCENSGPRGHPTTQTACFPLSSQKPHDKHGR